MARKIAVADPSTLAAAFNDHAQRTDGAWRRSRRRRPLGKGMPIRNAAGATASVVRMILACKDQPAAAVTRGVAANARIATRAATPARTRISRASLPAITLPLK